MSANPQDRLARAHCSLTGLSVGDAFGERFFRHRSALARIASSGHFEDLRRLDLGSPPWPWTDDTAMALSIIATLRDHQGVDPDHLAREFSNRYLNAPRRGYGPAMHQLLPRLRYHNVWRTAPGELFNGQGSFGNGAAMRVAPLGAYLADNLHLVVEHARRSAIVTHTHAEAVAGAIAVALAAAWAWRLRGSAKPEPEEFLELILPSIPPSEVSVKVRLAHRAYCGRSASVVAAALGNGSEISAQDTVPFVLWAAANYLDNFEEALWQTVSGLGDMDTTCAMVGGIVAMYTGVEKIPEAWRQNREALP